MQTYRGNGRLGSPMESNLPNSRPGQSPPSTAVWQQSPAQPDRSGVFLLDKHGPIIAVGRPGVGDSRLSPSGKGDGPAYCYLVLNSDNSPATIGLSAVVPEPLTLRDSVVIKLRNCVHDWRLFERNMNDMSSIIADPGSQSIGPIY
jgi:hypothetical protein